MNAPTGKVALKAEKAGVESALTALTGSTVTLDAAGLVTLGAYEAVVSGYDGRIDEAQADANAAIGRLDAIDDDLIVTPSEKIQVKLEWDIIVAEKPVLVQQAADWGVSSTTYVSKYDALNTYLNSSPGVLVNMSVNTTITSTFTTRFKEYYTEKVSLLNAIEDANIYLVQSEMALSPNMWTVKIDANNNIAGVGLTAYPDWSANVKYTHVTKTVNGQQVTEASYVRYNNVVYKTKADPPKGTVPTNGTYWQQTDAFSSEFGVLADAFWIKHPSYPDLQPFIVGLVDGTTKVGINGELIVDGTIYGRHIVVDQDLYIPWGNYEPPKNARFEVGAKASSTPSGWSGVKYEDANGVFQPLYPPGGVTLKSWNMAVYRRSTKSWYGHYTYDIANSAPAANTLANHLNATFASGDYICVIYTHGSAGDPQANSVSNTTLRDALRHTGGTAGILNTTTFKRGASYILVGIPYMGEGNGLEFYKGAADWDEAANLDIYFDIDTQYDVFPKSVSAGTNTFDPFTLKPPSTAPGLYLTPTHMGYWAGAGWNAVIQNNGVFYFGNGTDVGNPMTSANARCVYWTGSQLLVRGSLHCDDLTAGTIKTDQLWVAGNQVTGDGAASRVYSVNIGNKSVYASGSEPSWIEAGRVTVSAVTGRKYICYASFETKNIMGGDLLPFVCASRDTTIVGRSQGTAVAAVDTPATGSRSYIMWIGASWTGGAGGSYLDATNCKFNVVELKA
jgi:hypothetical protein